MRVNVRGTWLVTRALAPLFAEGGQGRIVNLASDTALWGAPRLLAYVASKGAVISMTRSLARELGPRGIGVTVVAPGIMRCEATEYVPAERHRLYETGRAVPGPQHAGGHRRHRRVPAHAGRARAHRTGAAGQCGVCIHMTAIRPTLGRRSLLSRARRDAGTPVVLLHGIGSNAQSFVPLMRGARSALHRVLAWDAPGYGDSTAACRSNGRMPPTTRRR